MVGLSNYNDRVVFILSTDSSGGAPWLSPKKMWSVCEHLLVKIHNVKDDSTIVLPPYNI
jgi:hypothetical protein